MSWIKRETCWKCVFFMAATGLASIALLIASYQIDSRLEARFQVVGEVRSPDGQPLPGINAVLFLQDPNLLAKTVINHRFDTFSGASDGYGLFKARVRQFYGSRYSWLFGLGKPSHHPFKDAWLMLRKDGYGQMAVKLNAENWEHVGSDWERVNAKLPPITLDRSPLPPASQ